MAINWDAANGFGRNRAQWQLQGQLGSKAAALNQLQGSTNEVLHQNAVKGDYYGEERNGQTGKYEQMEKGYANVLTLIFAAIANLFGVGAPKIAPADPGAAQNIPVPANPSPAAQIAPKGVKV